MTLGSAPQLVRRSLPLRVLVASWACCALPGQDAGAAAASFALPWLAASTPAAVELGMQQAIERLRPDDRRPYLVALGPQLFAGNPKCLRGAQRRHCVEAQLPVLAACAMSESGLVAWFAFQAASYLVAGSDFTGAEAALDAIEALVPQTTAFAFERREWRIACLTELRLAEADRLCELAEATDMSPRQRARVLGQRGSVNIMLGRLDLASRSLARASELLAGIPAVPVDEHEMASIVQFDVQLRQLDLLAAREQYEDITAAIRRLVEQRGRAQRPLSPDQLMEVETHAVAAAYHVTQHQPARTDAAVLAIEQLLATPKLPPRNAEMATIWLADMELRRGRLVAAQAALQRVAVVSASRRSRWLWSAIACELARRSGAPTPTLLQHELQLRDILGEMMAEWRQVAWERETTGFLRLGARLRVVAELIAVTTAVHGPEQALADVLAVQCCTTVSRARGAVPLSLAELREQLLPEGHGALVFVPAWNESHVFAFDRRGFVHEVLPRASELRGQAQDLRQELQALDAMNSTAPDLGAVRRASRDLANSLLPAAVRDILATWQNVTITGGSLLGNPCFECLEWHPDTLLGERFGIASTASLPLLAALRRTTAGPAAAGTLSARLYATLAPAAEFAARNGIAAGGALTGSRWERLAAGLPDDAERCVGPAATLGAWLLGCQARRDLTVLLGHGEQPFDDSPPAIGMTPDDVHPDGLLTPARITATAQHGLVVVAACLAARGPGRMGDDDVAATLAGAFLFAGAQAVIASPAPLRLSMHLDVAAELVAALDAGCDVAQALRRARVAAAAGDRAQAYRAAQIGLVGWGAAPLVVAPPRPFSTWFLVAVVAISTALLVLVGRSSRRWWGRVPGSR